MQHGQRLPALRVSQCGALDSHRQTWQNGLANGILISNHPPGPPPTLPLDAKEMTELRELMISFDWPIAD